MMQRDKAVHGDIIPNGEIIPTNLPARRQTHRNLGIEVDVERVVTIEKNVHAGRINILLIYITCTLSATCVIIYRLINPRGAVQKRKWEKIDGSLNSSQIIARREYAK